MIDLSILKPIADEQPYPLLFVTVSGAHLYGFPSPDSDYDLRSVHILPLGEVIGLYPAQETIETSGEVSGIELDLVTHDVYKFFEMLLKRNGYVMEQLYSPLIIQTSPAHEELKHIARRCLTRNHAHHYLGFVKTQWGLFEKGQPRQVKPLLYTYRVLLTGIHLMQSGEVEANLLVLNETFRLPYIADLIARKQSGENSALEDADVEFHRGEYERLQRTLEDSAATSALPDAPTGKCELNDLLLRIRGVK